MNTTGIGISSGAARDTHLTQPCCDFFQNRMFYNIVNRCTTQIITIFFATISYDRNTSTVGVTIKLICVYLKVDLLAFHTSLVGGVYIYYIYIFEYNNTESLQLVQIKRTMNIDGTTI